MTFSIVARSPDGSSWGVAVASKFLAVGAYVPIAEAGAGALATQSYANLAFRREGLALLRAGNSADLTMGALIDPDDRREERQVGIVDSAGGSASFTGSACNSWAGGRTGHGYAIQGNILTGPDVVEAMEESWLESFRGRGEPEPAPNAGMPLAHRLFQALSAGDSAGGDRRGRQSAALLVVSAGAGYGGGNDVVADLRVDDHAQPLTELARLLDLHELYFGTSPVESMLPLSGDLLSEVSELLEKSGHPRPEGLLPRCGRRCGTGRASRTWRSGSLKVP